MKLKVTERFMMAGQQYEVGNTVEVNAEKGKDLIQLKLASESKGKEEKEEKEVKNPPKDKMAGKNKTKGKK